MIIVIYLIHNDNLINVSNNILIIYNDLIYSHNIL